MKRPLKRPLHADFGMGYEPQAHLAARIPKELQRRLRIHCFTHDITVNDFTAQAIREQLARKGGRQRGRSE